MKRRQLLFSVTAADCEFKAKRGSGNGGQKKNKTSSAIQCFHEPSGAMGECEDGRSQAHNRKTAFEKMVKSPEFQSWLKLKIECAKGTVDITEPDESGNPITRKLGMAEV